jgi:hypothetical protein
MQLPQPPELPTAAETEATPNRRSRIGLWVVVALLGVVATTVVVSALNNSPETNLSDPGWKRLSSHDLSVVHGLGDHVQRFNAATLPLMEDYLDPTVSAQRWVRTAEEHIAEMRASIAAMHADILSLEDPGLRSTMGVFPEVLGEQLAAITELRLAVADQDLAAGKAALRHLQRATTQRQEVGLELLDQLRPYVDPEILQGLLQGAVENLQSPS